MVESGAVEKWSLADKEIALACASHNGDQLHVEAVGSWLKLMGLSEHDLVCGAHVPYDPDAARRLVLTQQQPCRLHNNCSGKHSGLLAGALQKKQSLLGYDKWDHPVQAECRKLISELGGIDLSSAEWGVDGCGIPTYAMPLAAMAKAMSHFLVDQKDSSDRVSALKTIRRAIQSEPHFVSGKNTFCTDFISASGSDLIVKTGAEGVYTAVLFSSGVSIALKVRDGATRASQAAMAALIQSYHGLNSPQLSKLSRYTEPRLTNWEGQEVGKVIVHHPDLNIK